MRRRRAAAFPRSARIRARQEFLRLQGGSGRRAAGRLFVVITEPAPGGESRLGITVSKRVGGAVVRNRVKRLVREVFRRNRARLEPPRSVLVIARAAAAGAAYAEVERELLRALRIGNG